jgi:hypothetical protein
MGKKILPGTRIWGSFTGGAERGKDRRYRGKGVQSREMGASLVKSLDQSEIIGATGSGMFHGRAGEKRKVLGEGEMRRRDEESNLHGAAFQ